MSSPAFFAAYARLLVSHEMLHELHDEPERLRVAHGLTPAELTLLRSATPANVHLTQGMVRAKRHVALELMLPRTMALLAGFDRYALVGSYVDDVLPRDDVDLTRAVTQGHDFVRWLTAHAGRIPAGLSDLARFELLVADLAGDHVAAIVARRRAAAGPVTLTAASRPVLTADCRAETYGIDVLALSGEVTLAELAAAGRSPAGVLVRKVWERPKPLLFRVGPAVVAMLSCCDGTRTVEAVLDRVGDTPELRARAFDALRGLAEMTVLSTAEG
nr:hypothetical protein [uncultured Actinoplanes sp.]